MERKDIWPLVDKEMARSKKLHPRWPVHISSQAGVVVEEAGELMKAALQIKYEKKGDGADQKTEMEKEAIQVIVTAIRFLENLK